MGAPTCTTTRDPVRAEEDAARSGSMRRGLAARAQQYLRSPAPTGMVLLAIVVGIGAGYGAVVFRWLIAAAHTGFFGASARCCRGSASTT